MWVAGGAYLLFSPGNVHTRFLRVSAFQLILLINLQPSRLCAVLLLLCCCCCGGGLPCTTASEKWLRQARFDRTPARAHALSASELNEAGGVGGRPSRGGVRWEGGDGGRQSITYAAKTRRIPASSTAAALRDESWDSEVIKHFPFTVSHDRNSPALLYMSYISCM